MATRGDLSQHSTLFYQLAFGGLFLALILSGARSMMYGSTSDIKLLAVAVVGITAVLALDKWYWILLPVLQSAGIEAPGLPFSPVELGQIAVITVYFVRKGLRNSEERSIKLSKEVLSTFPLIFWMFGMFCVYPCGMAQTGSSIIGGRFYMQVLLAWLTLIVASSWRFDEKNCRVLFLCLICGTTINLSRTTFSAQALGEKIGEESAAYEFIGFIGVYSLLFARYRLPDFFKKFWRLALICISVLALVYSGKRAMLGRILLIPFVKAFLTKRDLSLTVAFACIIGVILSMSIMGDFAGMYELPKSAKRALSIVAPIYRSNQQQYGLDDRFRKLVHGYAIEKIKTSPWIGMKGFAMDRTEITIANYAAFNKFRSQEFYGHAQSRNWHGALYAYPADFGIPALVFFLIFLTTMLQTLISGCRKYLPIAGIFQSTTLLFYSMTAMVSYPFLLTSGHSASTTNAFFSSLAMFMAIRNGIMHDNSRINTAVPSEPALERMLT